MCKHASRPSSTLSLEQRLHPRPRSSRRSATLSKSSPSRCGSIPPCPLSSACSKSRPSSRTSPLWPASPCPRAPRWRLTSLRCTATPRSGPIRCALTPTALHKSPPIPLHTCRSPQARAAASAATLRAARFWSSWRRCPSATASRPARATPSRFPS
eukprot:Amastigsp_a10018_3.p4 type:complete len:156 gc:universal Amastigsp_a10018_3:647-1114(+)